jgi:exodeoxyribonuclease VII large subunit
VTELATPPRVAASTLPGPFPVGSYAARLKTELQKFARVQLAGEVWGVRPSRARLYFELRDARGALPCSMWLADCQALGIELRDGMRVVVGGGCDYYPGSATSSPSFTFAVAELRLEGEGDLLAELQRLRRRLAADGLCERQKRLRRPSLPRTIGVVTGASGKARDDVVAGLRRRGWAGRLVWAFAPVQDRHAAPAIAAALRALAAAPDVDVVIVARGGGSLADLFAFCDEHLCRTVAMLRVPVISSVGHHTDRTLLDDVAAVACSTPTHAAEAAVPVDVRAARADLAGCADRLRRHRRTIATNRATLLACAHRLDGHGRGAILHRARALAQFARAPSEQVARDRRALRQLIRELRAAARRNAAGAGARSLLQAGAVGRSADRALAADAARRRADVERLRLALAAHDPERTLVRGYAIVSNEAGEPVASASAARAAGTVELRFRDGSVPARVLDDR